ncbi:3-isopropylmalate dehydrogenase (plasmid) [Buchnera aphidicola str. Ak (Acyrthosiphon kondoi)]|uniref:3-isopropylmalate dehydrogenase n=1 Tax=Buchnera aphidicola str. Ak (Acyrthosiphon kondoi) TaxID=1005090 RepID=G2LNM9_9GAMM|nr:3-isopropylmalate dehydrogenase [Buchnera aphidicola]AEO08937.1 3-isopropylmalate dehydrogenase [Buchnera aphidicola str. Ak (Acyrthosiphon kondoi)]WAI18666.1 MAG: 3-isopropylmalate dehydrogenase [Buchnera aphidicola (Acyrthosiphon caraganae)]
MKKSYRIAVLPGDGVGPEVMQEAYKIIDILKKKFLLSLVIEEFNIGGIAIDREGVALPKSTLIGCENADAILFGSVGGKKWDKLPIEKRPERASLLPLRKHFNLFSNLRPAKLYPELQCLSPLRSDIVKDGFDILCIRELTGGIYFGKPKGYVIEKDAKYAFDTEIYHEYEIMRIAHLAFKLARFRRKKVCSIDKSNVLQSSVLWREIVDNVSKKYPDVYLSHLYVDNATMQIIKDPNQFDILLCSNLFGDIISDECAIITGSIGMLPSASLNEKNFGLYEPAGGSAPDIQGKNIANPIAQILSLSMLIRYGMNLNEIADKIDRAVSFCLKKGYRTADIANNNDFLKTNEMGDAIADSLINGE